jgi:hypothetical protein
MAASEDQPQTIILDRLVVERCFVDLRFQAQRVIWLSYVDARAPAYPVYGFEPCR